MDCCTTARVSGTLARACRAGPFRSLAPRRRADRRNADLIATEDKKRPIPADEAEHFAEGLTERLGLDGSYILPAYEDPAHWMLKEGELPVNVEPETLAADPEGAPAWARVRARPRHTRWLRAADPALERRRWTPPLAQRALAAAPRPPLSCTGRLPVGLRLPIGSLPWVPPESDPHLIPQDPTEAHPLLPAYETLSRRPMIRLPLFRSSRASKARYARP